MKYGIVFPQLEIGHDVTQIRDYVQAVEALGFDYLLAYDHVIGANPDRPEGWTGRYDVHDTFHEPLILFSYLAAVTQHLEFVPGILILPQRPAVLVAKQAAQLDLLANGRLRMGVAIGWNKLEYDALGFDFHNRGKRMEEQIAVMQQLWRQESVTFQGEFHHIDNAGIKPLPVQRPIPIWLGGGTKEVVLRRMATLGDGWIANGTPLEGGAEIIEKLYSYLEAVGRKPQDFGIDMRLSLRQPESEWQPYVEGWKKLGATHLCFNTMDAGLANLDEHIRAIEKFKTLVQSVEKFF